MRVRFQADADLKRTIVSGLLRRDPGMDFQTASGAGLQGLTDLEVLAIAGRDGRILVSHDKRTMPYHFSEFIKTRTSPGAHRSPADDHRSCHRGAITDLVCFRAR
jgi:hypothetical protein